MVLALVLWMGLVLVPEESVHEELSEQQVL